jgi:hypothetical protein
MGTPAAIIQKTENGYRGIYCNYDGYPSHVGKILKEHYTDPNKVSELLDLGELSSLGERVNPIGPHSWKDSEDGTTVAYHRDRQERLKKAHESDNLQELIRDLGADYNYLFDKSWKQC